MRDISNKPSTYRQARAQACIRMPADCRERIEQGTVDKGDPREAARFAGMMAIKRCWELLPHCHPIPLQSSRIEYRLEDERLWIEAEVATIGNTGVEMEALTGASVAALTIYDMLKPHAGMDLEIGEIRLLEKLGGKSDHSRTLRNALPACIIGIQRDGKADKASPALKAHLEAAGFAPIQHLQIPGDAASIESALDEALAREDKLIISVGGTGLTSDDQAVNTINARLDNEIPGIMEAARQHGQARTPYALMSRGVAGNIGRSLVVTLPGSQNGMEDSWQAIRTGLIHAVEVLQRKR